MDSNSLPRIPSVRAICVNTADPMSQKVFSELKINEAYTPDYVLLGRSSSYLFIKEHPGKGYNTVLFSLTDAEGHEVDFLNDVTRPIMVRYREYLYNEMSRTGTWEVCVKMSDNPVNIIPEADHYRIVRYGTFVLENTR